MKTWTDIQLGLARSRMAELEAQAAAARLAAVSARHGTSAGLRGSMGRALIRAGHVLAPEPPMARPHHHRVVARQP